MQKKKLGKGLGALLKQPVEKDLIVCRIEDIVPTSDQPRKIFDEEKLKDLAASIRQHGFIQPIVVKREDDKYRIIAGERRYRAAVLNGLSEVKVLLFKGEKDYQVALIENIQREDLNPLEVAEAYSELIKRYTYTQQQLSEKVGKSRSEISNCMRLLNLSEKVKNLLRSGVVTVGQVRPLTVLSHEEQDLLVERILSEKMNARDVEKLSKKGKKPAPKPRDEKLVSLENRLKEKLPAAVKIQKKTKKIAITFEFKDSDNFDSFVNVIQNIPQTES